LSVSVLALLCIDFLAVLSLLRTFFLCQEKAPRKYERVRVYMRASWVCVCVCLWDSEFSSIWCRCTSLYNFHASTNPYMFCCSPSLCLHAFKICVPSNWPSAFYRFRVAATSNIRLIFVAMCKELGYDKIEVDVLWV
jgi:hypothetical protein